MKRSILHALLLLIWITAIGAAEDPPTWMRQAAAVNLPPFSPSTPAVVLLNESRVTVQNDGKLITTNRRVVRLLSREARNRLVARAVYRTDGDKVRDLHAWLFRPTAMFKAYDTPIDVAAVNDDIYNEARIKVVSAADDAEPGSIFGYESVTEAVSPFTQIEWNFQDDLPTVVSRLIVDLPDDWAVQTFTFNHQPIEPIARGVRTWELRDLAGIESEPYMPSLSHLVPRMALTFVPPPGRNKSTSTVFQDWREVSVWLAELNDPQVQPTPPLTAKAQELTANATSEMQKIAAIARYVQGFQYISIQTGLGRGGGYRPHTAGEIFAKSYGDCKDKVTVMRAMLKAVGITSYSVGIYSGDSSYVNEAWPSPQQFNHAIIAIKISDSTELPITLMHPPIGRLMIFDPTDPDTPLGDLPADEQGSFALLVAGGDGALLRMPSTASELNQSNRFVELTLKADGAIEANIQEESLGQAGTAVRRDFRHQSRSDFTRQVEGWLSRNITGAVVANIEPTDNWTDRRFLLKGDLKAPGYARLLNNHLLVFKPAVLNRRDWFAFAEPPRKNPVIIPAASYSDAVRVKLPPGFKIDEVPEPVTFSTDFGTYATAYEVSGDQLIARRNLVLQSATIPADMYNEVRGFFQKIIVAEQATVVLTRN
jgi:Domain of Unknown Function with PDB structure (DUF3857)/Transglutaminase-like superfamily